VTTFVAEASGLHKRYGTIHAVNDVSLHIRPGETYGLLGPNGAGKTTTISILSGLLEPDEGTVTVVGTPIKPGSTKGKDAIGLVPQDLAIYPDLTGEENLRFFASLYGMPRGVADKRIDEVLDVIGLTDRRKDRTKKYSGGMKRRLNIGIGLLHQPQLLVLDEPTVGVDPQSRNAILESVEALSGEGLAVLYTTHYMEEAERLCDRIGIIDSGRIIAEGTTRELVASIGEQDQLRIKVSGHAEDSVINGVRAHSPSIPACRVRRTATRMKCRRGRRAVRLLNHAVTVDPPVIRPCPFELPEQRGGGLYTCRPPRRVKPRHQACQRAEKWRRGRQPARHDRRPIPGEGDHQHSADSETSSGDSADRPKGCRLSEELYGDVAGPGTERTAQANLRYPLQH